MATERAQPIGSGDEARYRHIFERVGVSIWEDDFSAVKAALDGLKADGVTDIGAYLAEHPDFVDRAQGLVRVLDVNPATLRMFGAADKTELIRSLDRLVTPAGAHVFREELAAIAEGRLHFEAESVVRTLTGETLDILFTMVFSANDPGLDRVLLTVTDITARKQAERALREEAHALETLNRVGRALAAELDLERLVQAVTDAATEVSGAHFGAFFYNVKNESGESYMLYALSGAPREAFSRFGMPRNTAIFAPTFEGRGVVRLDDVTKDPRYGRNAPHRGMPAGHLSVCSYLAVPVVSRSGEVIGGLFFGHPLPAVFTERAERLVTGIAAQAAVAIDNARLYETHRHLIERLREMDRQKDEFLATLAHELRNPLAPLRNAQQLLRLAHPATDQTAPVHDVMERQLNHLVRLVDDLLEMSRITRGTFELRKEAIDLSSVVRNAVETSDPLIQIARHRLELSMPGEPLWIDGDAVRLAQILGNLLNNAAKYTPPGGRIQVELRREADTAVISVRDNGAGITADALPRIFDMFSRGDRAAGRDQGGLGIGLALAKRLAEMHGGSLSAFSEGAGKGSEFAVRLPLSGEPAPSPPPQGQAETTIPKQRILVVDDNEDSAETMSLLLAHLGAEVRVAPSGTQALELLESYEPAVVLLDLGMPGMDGFEVARRMRALFPERRTAIVALTGWGQEEDRRRTREAGFDYHIVKPADVGMLQKLLSTLAERP